MCTISRLQGQWWDTLLGTPPSRNRLLLLRSLIADHDEIGVDLLGYVKDHRRGMARAEVCAATLASSARSAAALSIDRAT